MSRPLSSQGFRWAPSTGFVWLVGAGPGDPDLITVKGERILAEADAILYDHLVSPALYVGRRARLVPVGKVPGGAAVRQERIHELMATFARGGLRIARLKGGDPLLFGRGVEEAAFLAGAGIPFAIVPGVSSFTGAAASALVPLTVRGRCRSVGLVCGRPESGDEPIHVPDADLVVFFMAAASLPRIVEALGAKGRAPSTPVLVVENATTARQKVIESSLSGVLDEAERTGLRSPALVFCGEVLVERGRMAVAGGFAQARLDARHAAGRIGRRM